MAEAKRIVRNHRLWEMYMITHADVAANHVDRGADLIEHVLGVDMVEKLEALLLREPGHRVVPHTPHVIRAVPRGFAT
jgi:manganese/zinc/iron transport system permease protein